MKTLKMSLALIFILVLIPSEFKGQEKNEQLWLCGEETVKPALIDEYLEMSRELIEICKRENFPFAFFTWSSKPFVYELWYPVSSFDAWPEIDKAWGKVVEQYGTEKYAAFNNTRVKDRSYAMNVRNDLQYIPENPDFDYDDAVCWYCREYSLIPGKEGEFEEAVKWMNGQRKAAGVGHFVMYGTGNLGYENPLYVEMISALSQEDFLKRMSALDVKMAPVLKEFHSKINQLIREKKEYYWWYLKDLSFNPDEK